MAEKYSFGFCVPYDTVNLFALLCVDTKFCTPFAAVTFGGMPKGLLFFPDSDCVATASRAEDNSCGVVIGKYRGISEETGVCVFLCQRCCWGGWAVHVDLLHWRAREMFAKSGMHLCGGCVRDWRVHLWSCTGGWKGRWMTAGLVPRWRWDRLASFMWRHGLAEMIMLGCFGDVAFVTAV